MGTKLTNCKICGAEMATNAKVCPKCGAKNKKPFYKKWWFWVIIAAILLGIVGTSGESGSESSNPQTSETTQNSEPSVAEEIAEITYTHYNVTELFDALNGNAMKAENTFKNQYVEIEGYLGTIDSSGKYIGVGAEENNWDYLLQEVQCYLKTDEQKAQVMEMAKGDSIIVRGKITSVGEVMGYSLNIDSIN